jgi:hypothetical protein
MINKNTVHRLRDNFRSRRQCDSFVLVGIQDEHYAAEMLWFGPVLPSWRDGAIRTVSRTAVSPLILLKI